MKWEDAVAWLVEQPDRQEQVRAAYFDQPVAGAAERYWKSAEWDAIQKWLPLTPGTALDVGAGNGIATFALAQDGWSVIALEPDPSITVGAGAIESLMEGHLHPVVILREFGEAIPIESNSIDLVIARQVLHHARDLSQLCGELARVLKPGGTLITVRDHVISRKRDLARFLAIHPLHSLYGGECAYRARDYQRALTDAGFEIERVMRPFDTVVNYAPRTRSELRTELQSRLERYPLGNLASKILEQEVAFATTLRFLSRIDSRPGRLYSFICRKPA